MDARSFQKAAVPLLPWTKEYDILLVVDADIVISAEAPPIPICEEGVGIVDESPQTHITNYYPSISSKFSIETSYVLNTGVLVIPRSCREALVSWYMKYVQRGFGHPSGFHYEQASIGFELITNNMYSLMDTSWNCIWPAHRKPCTALIAEGFHFIHFAGQEGWDEAEMYVQNHFSTSAATSA